MSGNKRCYIAGKISDLPEAEWRANFERAKAEVTERGYEPVCPIDLDHNHDKSWLAHMRVDLTALLTCDFVYAQRNWSLSRGATIEVGLAQRLGLIILFELSSEQQRALDYIASLNHDL